MSQNEKQGTVFLSDLDAAATHSQSSGMSDEERAGLMNTLKNKLQFLAEQHDDLLESLSPNVRKRVEILREIQNEYNGMEAKYIEERVELDAKYQKLYEPLYAKRFEIVNGASELDGASSKDNVEEKGVPDFWLNAMKRNELLSDEIHERDEAALKYLKDIKYLKIQSSDFPDGFKLDFFFDNNPFFKNSVLTKTYHIVDDDELNLVIGTEIEWFPGKNLTQKLLKKKIKKGSKNTKPITKIEKCESFFNFFNTHKRPSGDKYIDAQLQDEMEQDFDIGSTFRDEIIPHAVSWFTGEAIPEVDFDSSDDGEDDDQEESDDA
ncbi:Nucleosome assembly protein 1-like protein 1 [Zostera marina]|uniref:Nucleosome assembly protein 1-like protein 1 n=1 Tax=Zostera marina TaxID=29655 RepID=A0A0K9NQD0_ZOSMR|nr:Nucleosome assembly protein 1-like protein 1 [Zostera marina]